MQAKNSSFLIIALLGIAVVGLLAVLGTGIQLIGASSEEETTLEPQETVLIGTVTEGSAATLPPEQEKSAVLHPEESLRKKEEIALISYARKSQAELKSSLSISERFETLTFGVTEQGFAIRLQDSRAGAIFETDSAEISSEVRETLVKSIPYLLPFQNKIHIVVFSKASSDAGTRQSLHLSAERAATIYQLLRDGGVQGNRIELVGAQPAALFDAAEFNDQFSEQLLILMKFSDFTHLKTRSKEEQVKDLFTEFDKRRALGQDSRPTASIQLPEASNSTAIRNYQTPVKKQEEQAPQPPPRPRDKIFGSQPVFGPGDPL